MKNNLPIAVFSALVLLIILATTNATSAQTVNTWKGGYPGHETDWYFFKNWSLGRTPGAFDRVIIPDVSTTTRRYPVVSAGEIEIQSLEIQAGASLTLYPSARILAESMLLEGICQGCEWRTLLEGTDLPVTASTAH